MTAPVPFQRTPVGARAAVITAVVVLIAAVHLSYQYVVAPIYGYTGLTYTTPDFWLYSAMLALTVSLALIMPIRLAGPADFILWVLYIIVVIPSMTVSLLAQTLDGTTQLMLGFVITACFGAAILACRAPVEHIAARIAKLSPRAFWIIIAALSALTYLMLAASGSLRLALPGLTDVYSVRSSFVGQTAANRLVHYLVPNQANVVNPLIIAAGLRQRRVWLVVAGIAGELLLYGTAGYKTVLFAAPAVLIVAFFFRAGRRPRGAMITLAFSGVIAGSALVDQLLSTPWLTSLFTRRFIDIPGVLTGAWINVFSDAPKAHFAYSFLSPFLTYRYDVTPAYVVAAKYFGDSKMDANANLFADGFANFGWAGVAFEAAVLAVILVSMKAFSTGLPVQLTAMLVLMPSITLANTSVLTSLLTHGILLAILLMAFAPRGIWDPSRPAGRRNPPGGRSAAIPSPPNYPLRASGSPPARTWWQRGKRPATAETANPA